MHMRNAIYGGGKRPFNEWYSINIPLACGHNERPSGEMTKIGVGATTIGINLL